MSDGGRADLIGRSAVESIPSSTTHEFTSDVSEDLLLSNNGAFKLLKFETLPNLFL